MQGHCFGKSVITTGRTLVPGDAVGAGTAQEWAERGCGRNGRGGRVVAECTWKKHTALRKEEQKRRCGMMGWKGGNGGWCVGEIEDVKFSFLIGRGMCGRWYSFEAYC